ncbi:MAG: hypothetical protein R3C12_26065 [Planctomycetaceae bacterium]|nr:hypothetical protein [Planctomycetaceae bacterium]
MLKHNYLVLLEKPAASTGGWVKQAGTSPGISACIVREQVTPWFSDRWG